MDDREIIRILLPTDEQLKYEILARIAGRISGVSRTDPDTGDEYYDDSAILREVKAKAIEMAQATIQAKVSEIVEASLTDGFIPTNQWGEPKGERITLREMVVREAKSWMNTSADRWDNNKKPLQVLIAKTLNDVWAKELEKEALAAVAEIKAGINAKLTDRITEAVAALLRDPARK